MGINIHNREEEEVEFGSDGPEDGETDQEGEQIRSIKRGADGHHLKRSPAEMLQWTRRTGID